MDRNLAEYQVKGMVARKWRERRPATTVDEIDIVIDIATELYQTLANVLEAYNSSPFSRPDLPMAMARNVEEQQALEEARFKIAEFMRYPGEDPFNLKAFLKKDETPEDNSPMLGGDRKNRK